MTKFKIGDFVKINLNENKSYQNTNGMFFVVSKIGYHSEKDSYSGTGSSIVYFDDDLELFCFKHRSTECRCIRR